MSSNTKKEIRDWIIAIALAVIAALSLRMFVFEFVRVEQESMYPTLKEEQKLFINKTSYWFSDLQRYDIVTFEYEPGVVYVKRVIAKGGEKIRIQDNTVYINGKALSEPYLQPDLEYTDYPETTIPEGYYFLMGDNRPYSKDSRSDEVGFIAKDRIIGRALFRLSPFTKFNERNISQ